MNTTVKIKSPIIGEAFSRMSVYSIKLYRRGVSLRLLAALMGTSNYGTVYGHLIANDKTMMRVSRRRPPEWERALYTKWTRAFPQEIAAMEEKGISLRKWCCYHDIVTSAMGDADISSMIDKAAGSDIHDKDIRSILNEDFPNLGNSRKIYWAKDIDPDLYYRLDVAYSNGNKKYIYSLKSLGIKVVDRSQLTGFFTFSRRLQTEICIRRLAILAEAEVIDAKSIAEALSWLPPNVSEKRNLSREVNPGIGHQIARKMAAEAGL